jgi:D-alanine--poly(phosphoribitol) ligase subunit 2
MRRGMMPIIETILQELEKITATDEVRRNLDLDLYGEGILDSLGTVELMVAFDEEFGINITPAQIDRQVWSTPRKIIAYVEDRVKVAASSS